MKKRDTGIDLIRVVSALGIVLHHYSRELAVQQVNTPHLFGGDYATGNFGLFFLCSSSFSLNWKIVLHGEYKQVRSEVFLVVC